MLGPFDDLFDFDNDGDLDDLEKATEFGFIEKEFFDDDEDESDNEDNWDEDDRDEW